jgi:esterase/lipase
MQTKLKLILILLIIIINISFASNVAIKHNGLMLNGNYEKAESNSKEKSIFLILHGTLAYNKMEIIANLQELLSENDFNSLAINLALGINNRSSTMYNCDITHKHTQKDAVEEIDKWVKWLVKQGYKKIYLVGHSLGGNQIAWYYQSSKVKEIKSAILIAPATYDKTKNKSLQKELKQAKKLLKQNKGDKVFKNINFIYCKNSSATARAIKGNYEYQSFFDTPNILKVTNKKTLVIIGTKDKILPNLINDMKKIKNPLIKTITIKGADHFFMDLYLEDLTDLIIDYTNN